MVATDAVCETVARGCASITIYARITCTADIFPRHTAHIHNHGGHRCYRLHMVHMKNYPHTVLSDTAWNTTQSVACKTCPYRNLISNGTGCICIRNIIACHRANIEFLGSPQWRGLVAL